MSRERDIEHKLDELTEEIAGAKQALHDLAIECAFWKRAAEQALRMWERTEDESDEWREKLVDACVAGLDGLEDDILSDSDLRPASYRKLCELREEACED